MGWDKCGIEKCIRKFETLIVRTWDHDLNERSFLSRRDRKVVRNIFRTFIHYSCDNDRIHGVQAQLLYPKNLDNYFLGEFIKYNNNGIKKLYNKIDMSNDRMPDISTKGRYVLYFVTYLLYMGNNDTKFSYSDSARAVSKKVSSIVTDYLRLVSSVHSRFKCKCMFIGLPMYYIHLMSADDIIMAMESVGRKPRAGPEEYERNTTIHIKEMCAYQDFLNFIMASKKAKTKGLKISLCGIPFETDYSMSEQVMDGLCYCFTDEVTIKKNHYDFVQLYTKCHIGDSYEYLRLTDEYPTTKMSFSPNCIHDCSAIRIFKDKENDFYQNRHTLFFPDDCRRWKWYLDDDKHPSYDYSNDRERRPKDYHEYYIDNSDCDRRKNCPSKNDIPNRNEDEFPREEDYDNDDNNNNNNEDDLIKDEAPILRRHHGMDDGHKKHGMKGHHRRNRYDIYDDYHYRNKKYDDRRNSDDEHIVPKRANNLESARDFEDEMMDAVHNDDYTPKSLRNRRNRYLLQDEDRYYYDRGYRSLGAEKDVYKPHPDKDREYPREKNKSDEDRINDADRAMRRLESDSFGDSYRKIKSKMEQLEEDYDDLRRHAIELPKKLDNQADRDYDRSWF
nr:CPPV269 A-type inclusion protein [Cooks petrelpox virus]